MWQEYGLFVAKTAAVAAAALLVLSRVQRGRQGGDEDELPTITFTLLNKRYAKQRSELSKQILSRKTRREQAKADKKQLKVQAKAERPKLFVLHFTGDTKASQLECLRHEVSAILSIATPKDEVLVCLESPGGSVPHYGLAASQLARLRKQDINLTVAIDKVAGSGGYLMACTGKKILAAPYALVGSIGVVMQLPNFNKALKKRHIEFEQLTAGQYKRNLSMFGENTSAGRKKAQQDIEQIHALFKQTLAHYRPQLDLDTVATGEVWLAAHALEKGLVDDLQTSDDYLMTAYQTHDIYRVKQPKRHKLTDKFTHAIRQVADEIVSL